MMADYLLLNQKLPGHRERQHRRCRGCRSRLEIPQYLQEKEGALGVEIAVRNIKPVATIFYSNVRIIRPGLAPSEPDLVFVKCSPIEDLSIRCVGDRDQFFLVKKGVKSALDSCCPAAK